ncbi:odv-e27 [Leucania separata nucleopolyhedrovirus]|uniref:Odv-e27 n=1 Tax=Leucania separata nucleopolyhedrovirus TaxID=1307956 RepID=Q0ILA6_NPVLS|nr:odv-e27 [Leucania separata nucleopolyhedrovirus]AAR28777.1 odv-e27 [Leucania separata nucleopolyhedrovirus]
MKTRNKVRTVTEIVNGHDKLTKEFELDELNDKNLNSLVSYDNFNTRMVLAKYIAMLHMLETSQSLIATFRDRNAAREIVQIVHNSLAFVHQRANPMVNSFNRMEYVVTNEINHSIPGEPFFFATTVSDDTDEETIRCYIDRPTIAKTLEKQIDTHVHVSELDATRIGQNKLANAFRGSAEKRRRTDDYYYDDNFADIKLSEVDVTRYLTLLLMIEHAYIHYNVLRNYDVNNYTRTLSDHSIFGQKAANFHSTFNNLLMSKFKFTIEDHDNLRLSKHHRGGVLTI